MIQVSSNQKESFRTRLIRRGEKLYVPFPWRSTTNRWHALVAEIFLQRTRADQVVPVFKDFSRKYRTPEEFLRDSDSAVFRSLGLYWRDNLLKELAERISVDGIPEERLALEQLPGVGPYIAAAYRSFHLNKRDYLIDSNVVRVLGRFFGFPTDPETRRKKWFINLADELTPQKNHRVYNYALIDFTRAVCKTAPLCDICNLKTKCWHYNGKKKETIRGDL